MSNGDLNGDGIVDSNDITHLINNWNSPYTFTDLNNILANWEPQPEPEPEPEGEPLFTIKKYNSAGSGSFYMDTNPPSMSVNIDSENPPTFANPDLYIVVPTAHISENGTVFSDISMTDPNERLIWGNQKYNSVLIIGDYRGCRLYFEQVYAGSGTATFSYTYNGVTTSESLNYTIIDTHNPEPELP